MASIDLVVIGSEVLNGFTLDRNTQFIATELFDLGLRLNQVHTIRDDADIILDKLTQLSTHSDLLITTGGLGPTTDDLTVDILSKMMGVQPIYEPYAKRKAERVFRKNKKKTKNENELTWDIILKQTRIPQGSSPLKNQVGIAPGIWLKQLSLIALPGFPIEIKSIWPEAKKIIQNLNFQKIHTSIIPIWGLGESHVFSILNLPPQIQIGVHALPFGCRLFLSSANKKNITESTKKIELMFSGHTVHNPLMVLIDVFRKKKYSIGTIESCTGGLMAKLITDESGVSDIYSGSIVCYSNQIKHSLLEISESTLKTYGAVSERTAYEMAVGGLKKLDSSIILVTTGIAGPTGGSLEKPVGTVYIAIGDKKEKKIWVCKLFFPLGRDRFRTATSYAIFLNLYQKYIFFDNTIIWQKKGLGKAFKVFDMPQ